MKKHTIKKTLKIALYNLTTTTKAGGIESFNWGMAKALADRDYEVHIYGGQGSVRGKTSDAVKIFLYPFLPRTSMPDIGSRFRKFIERLSFGLFTFKDLVKGGYDLIYIHKPFDLPVVLLASRFSGAKVAFGSGGTEFFPGYRFLVNRADHFFACSNYNADVIKEYCDVKPQVLYNGVDTKLFKPMSPDEGLKKRLKIKDDEKVILTACRLVGWKGVQYAIKSLSLLNRRHKIKYLIIGDGEFKTCLEQTVRDCSLQGVVTFLGYLPNKELPGYYSITDIAVFPSIADETFGISIAEAMACEVPVIATSVGGIPEVVAEETGVLVTPKNSKAIANAIEELLLDEGLRDRLGVKARNFVVKKFSWDKTVEKFEEYIGHV
ncbi:MAG: glycosyltransferase family 4 protein [Thermodesulfobacteriota bacterium]